jgi:hypothetical protein
MKHPLTLALFGTLTALIGCDSQSSSVSSGQFHVDSDTGRATGQALGINFEVAGATRTQNLSELVAGKPEHTSAQIEITFADDLIIRLEMLEEGGPISFKVNGNDFAALKKGDKVVIAENRNVTVNGASRGPLKPPVRPTAQHVARFAHGFPNAGNAGMTPVRVKGKPFYGFDEENFSSLTRLEGAETEVKFEFRLLDSRNGKDIYEITRTVIERKGLDGPVTSELKGQPVTVTVEYAGKELVVFDDKYGIAKFTPVPEANPNQDAEVQFDLPEVEVGREPGEVEPELRLIPPNRKANQ